MTTDLDLTWGGVLETLAPMLAVFSTDPAHVRRVEFSCLRVEIDTIDYESGDVVRTSVEWER